MDWTDDELATLNRLWKEGKSASEIARSLRTRSRNSVIGKVHRLGLDKVTRETPSEPLEHRFKGVEAVRKVRYQKGAKPPMQSPHLGRPGHVVGDDAAIQRVRDKKAGEGRSLVERVENGCGVHSPNARPLLEATGCKWPIQRDGQTLYCCNPVQGEGKGRYWCAGHLSAGVMRQPGKFSDKAIETMVKHDRVEPMAAAA
ncbi:MAG: GcrA family cell cycle regulator [Phenylobacterium sp.]